MFETFTYFWKMLSVARAGTLWDLNTVVDAHLLEFSKVILLLKPN